MISLMLVVAIKRTICFEGQTYTRHSRVLQLHFILHQANRNDVRHSSLILRPTPLEAYMEQGCLILFGQHLNASIFISQLPPRS